MIAWEYMDLDCKARVVALELYTSVITSSVTIIHAAHSPSLPDQRPLIKIGLAHACWAANGRAILLRSGDTCDLEDCIDHTTDSFTGNETGGNSVSCEKTLVMMNLSNLK